MTVNEWRNEWVDDKVDEWMAQQAIVQKNEQVCQWLTVLMIILWMIDWKILIVWMLYGRICQRDLVCRHSYIWCLFVSNNSNSTVIDHTKIKRQKLRKTLMTMSEEKWEPDSSYMVFCKEMILCACWIFQWQSRNQKTVAKILYSPICWK